MLDIYEEMLLLVRRLEQERIDYALCGGMALAVYGVIRATVDIDLLVLTSELDKALEAARQLGFDLHALPMVLAQGRVHIHRVTKVDPASEHPLSIDFLPVTDVLHKVWEERRRVELEEGGIWVVSRSGLVRMKRLRGSALDKEDIRKLGGCDERD